MTKIAKFPIEKHWPTQYPDRIQLYSFATPNGVKVSSALEEMELPYEAHFVDLGPKGTQSAAFLEFNPNRKIPAIIDPNGPNGKPLVLFESGAILAYLAEKSGKLLPSDPALRYKTLEWVFFQTSHIGPTIGQLGWAYLYDGKEMEDKRPLNRFRDETIRLLNVLEHQLVDKTWLVGDEFTIADIAVVQWIRGAQYHLKAGKLLGLQNFPITMDWAERVANRPAVARGINIPPQPKLA